MWENEKRFPEVNKTWLYMFGVLIYCMNDFQFLLELVWKNCNNFYPEMSRSRHDWVCEVQNKKAIEKYVKLSFALAVITGSDSFSCEKNRFLQSRLQRVSWTCWQEWFEHILLTYQKQNRSSPELLPSVCDWWLTQSYQFIMESNPHFQFLFLNPVHLDLCLQVLFVVLQEELVHRRMPINNKINNCRVIITSF